MNTTTIQTVLRIDDEDEHGIMFLFSNGMSIFAPDSMSRLQAELASVLAGSRTLAIVDLDKVTAAVQEAFDEGQRSGYSEGYDDGEEDATDRSGVDEVRNEAQAAVLQHMLDAIRDQRSRKSAEGDGGYVLAGFTDAQLELVGRFVASFGYQEFAFKTVTEEELLRELANSYPG